MIHLMFHLISTRRSLHGFKFTKIKKYIREGYDLNLISRIQSDIPDFKHDDRY